MPFVYINYGLLSVLAVVLTIYAILREEGVEMATTADLHKLVDNMKRSNAILNRAAVDADRHAVIMDSFEKRLDLNHENMSKLAEYDRQMAAMDQASNGGPALDATFPSDAKAVPVAPSVPETPPPPAPVIAEPVVPSTPVIAPQEASPAAPVAETMPPSAPVTASAAPVSLMSGSTVGTGRLGS
jgi:hypothetical protein